LSDGVNYISNDENLREFFSLLNFIKRILLFPLKLTVKTGKLICLFFGERRNIRFGKWHLTLRRKCTHQTHSTEHSVNGKISHL